MDAVALHAKIYAGRSKAALHLGLPCTLYRPVAALPFGSTIATLNAAFNSGDSRYRKPNLYNDPIWYGDFDGRLSKPGDYMVRQFDQATWFIAAQQQLLPIALVGCNRSLRVLRDPVVTGVGIVGYGGLINPASPLASWTLDTTHITLDSTTASIDGTILWPASILLGGRSQPANGLPADVKNGGWKIMLPPSIPLTIQEDDILTDDLGRRFMVESAESSDLGWRLVANEAHP